MKKKDIAEFPARENENTWAPAYLADLHFILEALVREVRNPFIRWHSKLPLQEKELTKEQFEQVNRAAWDLSRKIADLIAELVVYKIEFPS